MGSPTSRGGRALAFTITSSMASCKTLPCVGCRAHVYPRMRKIPWHKGVRAGGLFLGRKLLAQQCTDRVNEVEGGKGGVIMSCSERFMFSGVTFLHSLATIYSIHTFGIGRPESNGNLQTYLATCLSHGPRDVQGRSCNPHLFSLPKSFQGALKPPTILKAA